MTTMYVHQVSERFSFGNDVGAEKEYTEKIDSAFSTAKRKRKNRKRFLLASLPVDIEFMYQIL